MSVHIDCYGHSDTGKVREVNEDRFLIADLTRSLRVHHTNLGHDDQTRLFGQSQGHLFVVADGMGGHAAGDRASTLAVDALITYTLNCMRWFFRLGDDPEDDFLDDLKAALEHCQAQIHAEAEVMVGREAMGTTVTAGYVVWPRLYVVHAGDSRCYLFRGNKLRQITKDHSVAQKLADEGAMTREEAEDSRWSHALWNVVGGGSEELRSEVYKAGLSVGDSVLLCSDGLTKHVSDPQIAGLLDNDLAAEEACREMVRAANDAGGSDNVTVVVARFKQEATPSAVQAEAVLDQAIEKTDPYTRTEPAIQQRVAEVVREESRHHYP